MKKYEVLAYYTFTTIPDPHREVAEHKQFFSGRDVMSRIYISEQGINGQMSAEQSDSWPIGNGWPPGVTIFTSRSITIMNMFFPE